MRKLVSTAACAVLLVAAAAQDPAFSDREAIRALADSMHAALRKGDDAGVARLLATAGERSGAPPAVRRPMSEVAGPFARIDSLRLLAPGVALAELQISYYGSMIVKRSQRVILIARKEAGGWRVDSYRTLSCRLDATPRILHE